MTFDVVVAGGGPVGLMLACELRLAGASPVVLERRAEAGTLPKANGLVGRIVEMLDYRGLLERFKAEAAFTGAFPSFPFGSVPLDFSRLDTGPLRGMAIQQPRMESLLTGRAEELDVEIRRGHEIHGLSQDDDSVHLDVLGPDGEYRLTAPYLVGCDGGHSFVREQAGIGFPGTTDEDVVRLGHFKAADSVAAFQDPEFGNLKPGWNRTEHGRIMVMSLQPGVQIVGVRERRQQRIDLTSPLELEEFRASVRRVLGRDLPFGEPIWLSRTVSQARQAEKYRTGRILLAGDAAHLFPAGGSALNVGLLDTVNLGWKLAAQVQGRAPAGLLDTYHSERHPVGARTLMQTRAQAALERAEDEEGDALRGLLTKIFAFEDPLKHLGELLHGSHVRYDTPGAGTHPLLGRFAPDLILETSSGLTRVAELLRAAKPVLLDLADRQDLRDAANSWADRITVVTARCGKPPADALLIRPDGYVAWAAEGSPTGLRTALAHWFGAARSQLAPERA
ncbi:MAG: hypothetical protein QOI21_4375 [Actinomycetota bacterium]|jgi:2-polyprenyl-6-methoxyphenol hydroxylase-like FAD-dependent oxidoreductase|nr:hypothetical protein [Actinomycetota bacterium]